MKCGEGIGGRIEHCFEESGGRKYKHLFVVAL